LAHRKGVDVLLKAFSQLPNTAMLVIAGTGDDELTLKETSAALGLTNRVYFVGRVEGTDKIYLLQNALATVMPSRVWEAFPLVVLETFAAGRPLIGTRVPGIADLVEESKTGQLFTDENADELAQILRNALADREKLHQMGTTARDVANRYSWESIAQKHIDLYQQLIRR
jgi:glycosyltransferase involved in cell wall biosynthesis